MIFCNLGARNKGAGSKYEVAMIFSILGARNKGAGSKYETAMNFQYFISQR